MARALTKRDRLLEGEDPESMRPQDTKHWISVYREMIAFKDDLLKRVVGNLEHVSRAAKSDLSDDVTLIQGQLDRYRRRMDFWVERQLELEELTVDAKARTVTFRDNSITLTKREFQLLTVLMSRPDKYFSAEQLLVEAWHDGRLPEESMRTYISRVRKKLKTLGNGADVVNKSRKGYTLSFEPHPK
ncbi:MAG TPA: winged helix-turn-helix domain-containing protein [Candidatus Dormibacteraeota bacterium]|nr:winged helix-turn-helix domain-containing protein [Candidatus Dormibacteraeota bacterium]